MSDKNEGSSFYKGYISSKAYKPIKLKVFNVNEDSLYSTDRNLEDNSFVPYLNLKITTENPNDYFLNLPENNIFIPEATKLSGFISEIHPPRKFNKRGIYKITFDNVTCPDGKSIPLKSPIESSSKQTEYNPLGHVGKTTLGLLGGSVAGALFSLQLGGLGLAFATHGYSLAAGAATGGFIGTVSGIVSKGKEVSIAPGNELTIAPIDEISIEQLKQITCKKLETNETEMNKNKIQLKILSARKKQDLLGSVIKVKFEITNNSDDIYKLNNFFLQDSQGKEYVSSIININDDVFKDFPPNETKSASLEFFIDYPKASHWLILKDKNFNNELGKWEIKLNS